MALLHLNDGRIALPDKTQILQPWEYKVRLNRAVNDTKKCPDFSCIVDDVSILSEYWKHSFLIKSFGLEASNLNFILLKAQMNNTAYI